MSCDRGETAVLNCKGRQQISTSQNTITSEIPLSAQNQISKYRLYVPNIVCNSALSELTGNSLIPFFYKSRGQRRFFDFFTNHSLSSWSFHPLPSLHILTLPHRNTSHAFLLSICSSSKRLQVCVSPLGSTSEGFSGCLTFLRTGKKCHLFCGRLKFRLTSE